MRRILVALIVLATSTIAWAADPAADISSPGGKVRITLALGARDAAVYSVWRGGRPVIADARLGLDLVQGGPLGESLRVVNVSRRTIDERYPIVSGKQTEARNHCVEATVSLEETTGAKRRFDVVLRAYDEGAALRYVLPAQPAFSRGLDVAGERTEFRFLGNHRAWALQLASFQTSNEREFEPVHLNAIKPEWIVGPPLTIEIEGGPAVSIAEGNLKGWSGLHLAGGGEATRRPVLVTKLAPRVGGGPAVRASAPATSPWRVLMMADRAVDLIGSTILTSLADPSIVTDTSWIKPGKVAWDWWNGPSVPGATFPVGMNAATMRHFIDFASEFGLEYLLIDAGWYGWHYDGGVDITTPIPELDLPGLIAYGRERKVGILLWLNWENVRDQMDVAFPLYEKWGIKGVKIDYMDRKDQEVVAFYHRVLRTAAKYHLAVDFHGAYAGSGEERTYPHFLTREGIMGLEYLKWSDRVTPEHNVTIPFTRMLLGPMDYTPGAFRNVTREAFAPRNLAPVAMGTRAHQLAMYVVYESGLQMLSDNPDAYRGQAGAEFLKVVPASWDETRPLDGAVGDFVVIARRKGDQWFVGAMSDDSSRRVTVPLSFLGAGDYVAKVYADGPAAAQTPTDLSVTDRTVRAGQSITLDLSGGGGAVVHLRKAQ
jgi:alpha-glucosidase